jgi:hypothetical protein
MGQRIVSNSGGVGVQAGQNSARGAGGARVAGPYRPGLALAEVGVGVDELSSAAFEHPSSRDRATPPVDNHPMTIKM